MTNGKDTDEENSARRSAARTQPAGAGASTPAGASSSRTSIPKSTAGVPVKRTVGEHVIVSADVYADGHDVVAAALLLPPQGRDRVDRDSDDGGRQRSLDGGVRGPELGRYEYTVEGWIDRFGTWRHEISKKFGAGQDISSELLEGAEIVSARSDSGIVDADTQTARGAAPRNNCRSGPRRSATPRCRRSGAS